MSEAMDKAKFEMAVAAERQRQIEKGYTPAHDDKKGAKHLINWACDYIVKGEPVKAMALLVATLQHLERLSPAQLPDRETLTAAVCSVTDLWDEPLDEVHDVPQIVNAVLAALSTQPAAGEVEAAKAEAWDEGALWAAVECGAIRDERNVWLARGDNPYRSAANPSTTPKETR